MDPQVKASLLWGVVGALSFLVAIQAYDLLRTGTVDPLVKAGVALAVAVVAAAVTHLARPRLRDISL